MTTDYSYYAIFVAALTPYLFTLLAKVGGGRPYNNHDPRAYLAEASGRHKRANNAQLNSFEAFPMFAVGVLVAHQKLIGVTPVDFLTLNWISWGFVGVRLLYGWAYITDRASLRSMIWFIGISLAGSLYFI